MRIPPWFLPCLAGLILAGCQAANESAAADMSVTSEGAPAAAAQDVASKSAQAVARGASGADAAAQATNAVRVIDNRMVIRTAEMTLRVDDIESAEQKVQSIVGSAGGYIGSATSTDLASEGARFTMEMRVPVQAFEGLLDRIEALGTRLSLNLQSEDVTEQVVDLDARVKTLLAQEDTFREILRNTRDMEQVIRVHQHLTEIRATVESIQAQRKSLATRAALSTIRLNLVERAVPHAAPTDPNWMAQVWAESTSKFMSVVRAAASMVVWMLVFSPLWLPALWLLWRAARPKRPSRAEGLV